MNANQVIVIGASAGGLDALGDLLSVLSPELQAAVFVVLHIPLQADDLLPTLLAKKTSLKVQNAIHGGESAAGNVYVAPPDFHLALEQGRMRVVHGPRINRHRPAIDPLFRSAAKYCGPRAMGVLLSGYQDDGVAGLNAIKTHGGTTLVQTPEEALVPDLVENALRNVQIDYCLTAAEIGRRLGLNVPAASQVALSPPPNASEDIPVGVENMISKLGGPMPYTCPECNGPLWDANPTGRPQYSCHVGHQYSPASLLEAQEKQVESALWSAIRLFEEQADLLKRLMKRDVKGGLVKKWQSRIEASQLNADSIRTLLQRPQRNALGQSDSNDSSQAPT